MKPTGHINFDDNLYFESWRKIVGKRGDPTPEDLKGKCKEQLEDYASNCQRFLDNAILQANDPEKNKDRYWTAAVEWWRMRIEAISTAASRAQTVPLPRFREHRDSFTPYPSFSARKTARTTSPPTLTAIRPLPTPVPLETSYLGKSWTTAPQERALSPPLSSSPTSKKLLTEKASTEKVCRLGSPTYSDLTSNAEVLNKELLKENKLPPTPPPSPSDANFSVGEL